MKKRYIITIIAALAFGFQACMPEMELENPNAVTTGSYYKNAEELEFAVNGAYNMLQRNGGWGRYMFYTTNARGDDWDFTYKASNGMKEVPPLCNFTYSASNLALNECWDDMNIMMYAANLVLEKAPDADANDSIKNRIMGEAYFLRGLSLYYLGQLYGEEIPVRTTTPQSVDDYFAPSAAPGELYAQMVSDFKTAAELLPIRSVMYSNDKDVGRATKGAALGFLAKAYMNRPVFDQYPTPKASEWALAETALKQIIESGEYDLLEVFRQNHTEEFENNIESLFEIQFSNGEGGFNSAVGEDFIESWGQSDQSTWRQQEIGQKDGGDNSNWWNMMPVRKTYDEYETNADTIIDPRVYESLWCMDGAMYQLTTGRWLSFSQMFQPLGKLDPNYGKWFGCRKYCGDEATTEWETGINDRILRYSDILLMYAECLVELGREGEAIAYIDRVRTRANNVVPVKEYVNQHLFYVNSPGGLPPVQQLISSAPTINGTTINTVRRAIKHERFVELFGEGHRFMDLLRWNYNANDPDNNIILDGIKSKGNGFVEGVHEYFPIPSAEITTNPNIKPNRAN